MSPTLFDRVGKFGNMNLSFSLQDHASTTRNSNEPFFYTFTPSRIQRTRIVRAIPEKPKSDAKEYSQYKAEEKFTQLLWKILKDCPDAVRTVGRDNKKYDKNLDKVMCKFE